MHRGSKVLEGGRLHLHSFWLVVHPKIAMISNIPTVKIVSAVRKSKNKTIQYNTIYSIVY